MRGVTPTVYLRHEFQATPTEAASSNRVVLRVNARDGYLIYLNGTEVARADLGAPGSWVFRDQRAHFARTPSTDTLDLGPASSLLQSGTNLLAVLHANDAVDYEQLYDGHSPSPESIHFNVIDMTVGASTIAMNAAPWSYFVGLAEPSGGLLDPTNVAAGFVDWVELHNPGAVPVDLSGWSLTDDPGTLQKWIFPAGVEIPAGDFLLIACSGKNVPSPPAGGFMHTNFSLDDRGEFVALVRPNSTIAGQFDKVPDQDASHTWGLPAGGGTAGFLTPTPGATNSARVATGRSSKPDPTVESGVFASSLPTVALASPPVAGSAVHYTLDGSEPDQSDPVFPPSGIDLEALSPALPAGRGYALREIWFGLGSNSGVHDLPLPRTPDVISLVTGAESSSHGADLAGERVSGLIIAPVTGDYRFYLASDDEGVLFLSSDDTPAGLSEIATVSATVPDRVWDARSEQQSALITLQMGESYAFEVYNFNYDSRSASSVGWLPPGATEPTLLPASVVAPPASLPPGLTPPSSPRGATLRLRTFAPGMLESKVATRSYAAGMAPAQSALASVFLSGDPERKFFGPNGIYGLSGGSLVEDPDDSDDKIWRPTDKRTDHTMALAFGRAFERPAVFEAVLPDGSLAGRTGAGLRFSGSAFSRPHYRLENLDAPEPWTMDWRGKPQMNIFFRGPLGDKTFRSTALLPASTIDDWNSLRLRAGRSGDNITLTYDELVRRMFAGLGQPVVTGRPVNSFINGQLRGLFLLLERPREDWLQTYYDTNTPFTLRVHDTVESGDPDAVDDMFDTVKATDCATPAGYAVLSALWDLENVADYAILNSYIASGDFIYNDSDQNFVMFRDDRPGGKWRFSVWDAESSFGSEEHEVSTDWTRDVLLDNTRSFSNEKSIIRTVFRRAYQNPEFHVLFADRVQRAFGPGGMFASAGLASVLAEVNAPLAAAQTAWLGTEPNTAPAQAWFAAREAIQLGQWSALGLWPAIESPGANPPGGVLSPGATVVLSNSNSGGDILYTLDGSDPRAEGGATAPGASTYSAALSLPTGGTLKARVLLGGSWSPLLESVYAPDLPSLAVTEIHYNPDGPDDLTEFVEVRNLGPSVASLNGARFIDGITFTFGAVALDPGERLVLVKDSVAFAAAYPSVPVAGQYGSSLANGGETLHLVDAVGNTLVLLTYGDDKIPGWPPLADGKGRSLVLRDEATFPVAVDAAAWRDSFAQPTPGGTEMRSFGGDPHADVDGDRLTALIEHAMGSSDHDRLDLGHFVLTTVALGGGDLQGVVELRYDLRASDTELDPLFSANLVDWQVLTVIAEQDNGDGTVVRTYQCPAGNRGFVRLRATTR